MTWGIFFTNYQPPAQIWQLNHCIHVELSVGVETFRHRHAKTVQVSRHYYTWLQFIGVSLYHTLHKHTSTFYRAPKHSEKTQPSTLSWKWVGLGYQPSGSVVLLGGGNRWSDVALASNHTFCMYGLHGQKGATENARHENTGRSKMQDLKMRDMNLRHQFA